MADQVDLVWVRERRAPRRQAPSVERIVATAIAIADTDGTAALSMRRVAADLASGTASLYRFVTSRDELLDLMIDAVQGEDDPPALTGDWRADLTSVAARLRTVLLRHAWLGAELTGRPTLGPNSLRQFDTALAAAVPLAPDITLAANVVDAVMAYVFGAVARELAEIQAQQRTGLTEEQWRAGVGPYIQEVVASGAYPQFARRVIEARDADAGVQFTFGLTCLLDGVAGVTTATPPRRPDTSTMEE